MNKIIINIDNERDAHVVSEPKYLIYLNEYYKLKELLKESIKSAKNMLTEKKAVKMIQF